MRTYRHLQIAVGMITVLTFFWVSTIEAARPIHVRHFHAFSKTKPFHVFNQSTRIPSPAIIREIYQKIPWNTLSLSEKQHTHIQKAFREFWLNSLNIQHELEQTRQAVSSLNPTTSDKQTVMASLQVKTAILEQELAKGFARHFAAIRTILTPEQRKKIGKFKAAARLFYKIGTQCHDFLLTQGVSLAKTLVQSHPFIQPIEYIESNDHSLYISNQNSPEFSPTQYLHQLQILRL